MGSQLDLGWPSSVAVEVGLRPRVESCGPSREIPRRCTSRLLGSQGPYSCLVAGRAEVGRPERLPEGCRVCPRRRSPGGGVGIRGRREGAGRGPGSLGGQLAGHSRSPAAKAAGAANGGAEAGRRAALIGWRRLHRRARPPLHVCAGVGSWRQGGRRMQRGRSRAGRRPRRALSPTPIP